MAILEINTTNADVSWVIFKNPQTQKEKNEPFKKPLRNGYVYGWYVQENHFKMFFKDGKNSSFYKELDNIHLDQSAYNCSYVYCAMISEMLRSTIQSQHEKDIVCKQTVKLNTVYLTQLRVAESFIKYFSKDVHIELKELSAKIYSVEFSGAVSLFYLINLVQVFCLLQSIEDRNLLLDLSTSTLTKYAHNLINIDAPYFIVYIFISRAAKEMQSFKAIKNIFEQFKPNWNLSFGNTQKQRYDVIKNYLKQGKILHDIGCGELFYSKNLATKFEQVYAWDADKKMQERNARYIEKKSLHNIELKGAFEVNDLTVIEEQSDILITEMLEHIEFTEAMKVLKFLSQIKFHKLVITVPNRDFNQYYKLEHQFRHDDHKWEPNFDEVKQFISLHFDNLNFSVNIVPIGDKVDNISLSTLVYIERK